MKSWINKNYRVLINIAFLIPIIIVAFVSISHVTVWYDISNPVSWATYLSVGIEIAALSALAAISANMGKKVYFPFIIVTLIQFIGNIFFSYQFIDINGKLFRDWVDLFSPILGLMGIESTDLIAHKRFLALFSGGLLPLISLSFLHMIVKFTEEDRIKQNETNKEEEEHIIDEKILEEEKKKWEKEFYEKMDGVTFYNDGHIEPTDEELKQLEEYMKRFEKDYYQEETVNPEDEIYKPDELDSDTEEFYNSYDFENEEGQLNDDEEEQLVNDTPQTNELEEVINDIQQSEQPVENTEIQESNNIEQEDEKKK